MSKIFRSQQHILYLEIAKASQILMSNNFSNQQFQELLQVKIMSYFCPQRMIFLSGVVMNLDN